MLFAADAAQFKSKYQVVKHGPRQHIRGLLNQGDLLSLLSEAWREVTTAHKKQEMLENSIKEVRARLQQLAKGWHVNADSNVDREQRRDCAAFGDSPN